MKVKPQILIPVLVVTLPLVLWRYKATRPAPIPTVKTAMVSRGLVERTVSASGKIQPFSTVDVKSKAGGTVIKMAVEEGTRVRRGQLICLIDRRDNLASYNQARADVESARAGVEQAQAGAQLQERTLGPQIRQAQETVAASRARLLSARSALLQQKAATRAQIEQSQAAVAAARANLKSALESSGAQPDITSASIAAAHANVASALANLQSAQQGLSGLEGSTLPRAASAARSDVASAKSNLDIAKRNLDRQKSLFDKGFVAQNTLDTAQNGVDVATAALDTAQSRLDTLEADQGAQKQDASAKVAASQAALAAARAAYVQATTNRVQDRVRRVDVEASRAALQQAQAGLAASVAQGQQIAQREADITAEIATLRQNEAALQSTRANSLQTVVKRADVVSSQANLQKALQAADQRARNLEQTTVLAPREGVILQKYVDTGAIIQSGESGFSGGTNIVQLADVGRVYVIAQVDEADVGDIKVGQKVRVLLDAYPDQTFEARVRKIFPQADAENNITFVKVQVEILTTDARLRPNLNATCDFVLQERPQTLSLPVEAIREEGHKTFVMRVINPHQPTGDPKNQRKVEVKLGAQGDERVEIKSGVRAGDVVVLPKAEVPVTPEGGPF